MVYIYCTHAKFASWEQQKQAYLFGSRKQVRMVAALSQVHHDIEK